MLNKDLELVENPGEDAPMDVLRAQKLLRAQKISPGGWQLLPAFLLRCFLHPAAYSRDHQTLP
jgi:hypothetical protein